MAIHFTKEDQKECPWCNPKFHETPRGYECGFLTVGDMTFKIVEASELPENSFAILTPTTLAFHRNGSVFYIKVHEALGLITQVQTEMQCDHLKKKWWQR